MAAGRLQPEPSLTAGPDARGPDRLLVPKCAYTDLRRARRDRRSGWIAGGPGRCERPASADGLDQAAFAEDRHRAPHGDIGDAELLGKVAFGGQLAWVPARFDARGEGVSHLLVDAHGAGAVNERVIAHICGSQGRWPGLAGTGCMPGPVVTASSRRPGRRAASLPGRP